VSIVPFEGENAFPLGITGIVGADLTRSGLFKLVDYAGIAPRPARVEEVRVADWRARGADAVAVGTMRNLPDGRVEVRFALVDTAKQAVLANQIFTVTPAQFRATAHKIADVIYEKLTGDVGVFATKICYVTKSDVRFELQVSDADGYNADFILAHKEPIISPQWSPDGSRIAYVSFERRKPIVFIHNLVDGTRTVLANYEGSNSAPAWAPDGRRLAVVLTKDGTSNIYLVNADGSGLTRLTNTPFIDTEPNFSPDGKYILFTSDRAGSPQIYRMRADGSGDAERMTFEGNYNVTPRYAPDGKSFIFIHRSEGRFNVAVQEFGQSQMTLLTSGGLDQSPTFAPNGKMVLYASEVKSRGILAAVSSDGRIKQRITAQSGDIREPAWGPLPNRRKE
jgi:TolB protein